MGEDEDDSDAREARKRRMEEAQREVKNTIDKMKADTERIRRMMVEAEEKKRKEDSHKK
ncbi:hypothetical protein [Microvirga sp. KLBC 81]|uniref:hypothetical protein n=1 Tax=Microvirga sp. KLBC 81 TaxID=1862707 RepID=UPI0014036EE0|nr:hypothetical protein [Microvirga sp. KLBC 81]